MAIVLVTGASGFLGTRLVEKLSEVGFEVRTIGRSKELTSKLASLPVEHRQVDILDYEAVKETLSGVSAVFHLAGLVSYKRKDYDLLYKINVLGTRNVMKACLESGIERVIHMGSIAGMGIPQEGQLGDENIAYNLKGHGLYYCDTKYEAEQEVLRLVKQGLQALCLNPGITFGEGDTHSHHHTIFQTMACGTAFAYPCGGVMFSDIEDVIYACLVSLSKGRIGERYVIGTANLSFKEAGDMLASVIGCSKPLFVIPGWLSECAGVLCESTFSLMGKNPPLTWQVAWLSQRKIFFSSQKAMDELAYRQTPFIETLKRTAPYYLSSSSSSKNVNKDSVDLDSKDINKICEP